MSEQQTVTKMQELTIAMRELKKMRQERDLDRYDIFTRCAYIVDTYEWDGGKRSVHDEPFLKLFARRIAGEIANAIRVEADRS